MEKGITITLKNVLIKEIMVNLIVDMSNIIDVVVETLLRKSTIKKWFVIIKYYYMYLSMGDYVISQTIELNSFEDFMNYQFDKYL